MQLLQMSIGNMEVWQWLSLVAVMMPMSIKDIKEKRINGNICILAIMAALVFRVTCLHELDIVILLDMVPGFVFLLFSYISREEIGYGDGMMLIFTGCVTGFGNTIFTLMISLSVILIWGLVMEMTQGNRRKYEIPFVPFMSVGALAGGFLI